MTAAEPLTIAAAAPLIRAGELTPSELLEQCLRRIDIYEPAVQAWVYLDRERARRDAGRLTDEAKAGRVRGPLHGIPVGVKDIIDVFDMPTGCGSKLWANSYARRDATVVERLRQAGAVILGKTVTTPYAYLDPPPTRNPWDLSRTPGGSSSGSAAAVACGMCLAALGTQTGGSLTRPASYCGVCSLKPTHGRVSVNGVLPLAPTLDHIGIMANSVRDLAVVFEAIAGTDGDTSRAWAIPAASRMIDRRLSENSGERSPDFVRLHGLFSERASERMSAALARLTYDLKSLATTQASVIDGVPPAAATEVLDQHRCIMATEAAVTHADRMAHQLDDYPPEIAKLIADGLATPATEYREARLGRDYLEMQLDDPAVWSGYYLTPATTDVASGCDTTGSPVMNALWSFAGLPTVSLPFDTHDGLPLAVQITGRSQHEGWLLATAAWVERVIGRDVCLPPVPG